MSWIFRQTQVQRCLSICLNPEGVVVGLRSHKKSTKPGAKQKQNFRNVQKQNFHNMQKSYCKIPATPHSTSTHTPSNKGRARDQVITKHPQILKLEEPQNDQFSHVMVFMFHRSFQKEEKSSSVKISRVLLVVTPGLYISSQAKSYPWIGRKMLKISHKIK